MDNLFTINIDPDENICLNDNKNQDEITKRAKYKNEKIDYIDADSFDLISYEINEICKADYLDTIGEINDNQINEYQNIRKKIQKFIFKCFKEDDIVIDFPGISEDAFIEQPNLKNVKITLKKDKIDEVIAYSSREKFKRNKPNELNNRYYCEKNIFDENEIDDTNFIDMLIGNDTSIDKIDSGKENEPNKDMTSQNVQCNEGNNIKENEKITQYNDNLITKTINSSNDCNNETLEKEGNDEKSDVIKYTNNTINENTLEPFKLNNIISEFRKKINNWLIKFPDIDCENFFFHLFFLSELHREKGSMCHNCGSHNMEKCSTVSYKCENNYCFMCDKHIMGYTCHNTRVQYNYFKPNILKSLYDAKIFKYPNNLISCLKCMSNGHYICGSPPYVFAQESYMFRKEFNRKFDYANYVYFKNSRNIWEIKDSFKNMANNNNNNSMIRVPSPNDDNNNCQNQIYTNKNSMKRHNNNDDYNNKNNIVRYIDDNEDSTNDKDEMDNGIYKNKNKKRFKSNRNINISRIKYDSEEYDESEIGNDEYDTGYNKYIHNDNTQLYKRKRGFDNYHHENNNFNSNNKRKKRAYNDNNNNNNNYGDSDWNNENNNNMNGHKNMYRNLYNNNSNNNRYDNKMKNNVYDKNNKNTNYNYNKKNFYNDNKKYDNNKKEKNSGYYNNNEGDNINNNEPLLGFNPLDNYMSRNKKSYAFLNNNYTKTNKNNSSNAFSKNYKKNEYAGSSSYGFANNNKHNNSYKGLYKNGNVNWDQHHK
ncbi:uncharacterized protein PY17X_1319900 [Plasmodium yoelii]|uniref:Homeobox-containing protein n=2 Tax=Plasmodium yoelii TaxID=5861 RepID=A0AAE9WWI9_PLAYO|nr:uncharacterized protein PY17X_1319900 [Plasmodium yoelii]WBY59870.1 hypothetical protein Py17XNL_001303063 [Plasmodium yoelii yoelii]CDU19819.1 conserved Plasmodium protein, unknown function [Plasmodium yoelii]VTZ80576.1 conserved Plasmodium protein, unknown function [Plasmodium yoelii]|eukprot:XP_725600.2 uncharacterized protein PY17X_1319900 [Plasmodium yoelii]